MPVELDEPVPVELDDAVPVWLPVLVELDELVPVELDEPVPVWLPVPVELAVWLELPVPVCDAELEPVIDDELDAVALLDAV